METQEEIHADEEMTRRLFQSNDPKEDALRILFAPLTDLAAKFEPALYAEGFNTYVARINWVRSTVTVAFYAFSKEPTADHLRSIMFNVYKKEWGAKPPQLYCHILRGNKPMRIVFAWNEDYDKLEEDYDLDPEDAGHDY